MYHLDNLPFGVTNINYITVGYYAKKHSSSAYKFDPLIIVQDPRYGYDVYSWGTTKSTTSAWASYSHTWSKNPRTGSDWTAAEVNALRAGMRSSDSNGGAEIANLRVLVNYN
ncbi:TPA: hypothetical protein EYP38_02580 [Candidatus Micrarchaeota archaeon]|nr:hypothetical protein [Candidatus Micrarchaeota archaeon]